MCEWTGWMDGWMDTPQTVTTTRAPAVLKISDRDPGHRVLDSREKDWKATTRDCVKGLLDFHLL